MTDYNPAYKNEVRLKYKIETGQDESAYELHVTRSNGRWIINLGDDAMMQLFGPDGTVEIPDQDYLNWLEETVNELI